MKFAIALLSFVFAIDMLAQSKPAADLLITNAKIWTGDKAHPSAQAVAVIGDRIVAVGSNSDVQILRGAATKTIDARGKLLLPGFNDAHVHFVTSGTRLNQIQLNDATSMGEFTRRIADRAKMTPKGEWIEGGDWDETKWTPAKLPTKDSIDSVTPDTPVFLEHHDGHMALANSVALRLAGVSAQTPDPPGGTIVRDAQGNPTGALKDAARNVVLKVIPPPSHDQRLQAMRRSLERAAELGVTSVQDMNDENSDSFADIRGYGELLQNGELTARVYVAPAISDWEKQAKVGIRHAFGSSYLRIGATKGFADGSLGSSTAYFFDPYNDDPNNSGLLGEQMHPLSQMREWMMQADAAGLQICTHAIGDRAVSTVLDLYTDVVKAHRGMERRFRIEHAQHLAAKDFARFSQLDAIASVQPYQAIDDGRWAEVRIGHDRASRTYAFRTFLNHGVHLAFGTDWPYAPLDPMLTVYAAVTRATLDGKNPNGWFPDQKLTVAEAVEEYTTGSAYAEFQEKEKGSIMPGMLADMVLLSDDIFTIDAVKIRDVKVIKTIVGGRVVWDQERKKQYSTAN
ncbi:MAG TPA: amidohydrolase [Terriglobales bacterium]|jgi:predicted amidohydrolase YtcJ|nr:amidohydrolase [Terriglobales bacterium]